MAVDFEPIGEIMRMSGPWTGYVSINGKDLSGKFIIQEPVLSEDESLLFLVFPIQYSGKYQFTIVIADITTVTSKFICKREFDYLYISRVIEDRIYYHNSFHNQSEEFVVRFDEVNFNLI